MRSQLVGFIILFCLLQFACKRNKQQQTDFDFKPPKIVEARSYKVPPEKMALPKVIPAIGVKKIAAGKPEIAQLKSNVFPAKAQRIIQASVPKSIIPGEGSFMSPRVVPAIDSPFAAGAPEILMLKDPYIKENNPESFSSIKAMHGLNSNELSSLCQDKAGNLWIGEWWGGVSKYDGKFLSNYSIPQGLSSEVVNCVFADRTGNIWIGTSNTGVNKFDGRYITRYSMEEGLSSNFVWNMMQDKNGDMWFATDNGVNKYDGHSFTHYTTAQGLPADSVRGLLEDSRGYLWFGAKGGLARFDGHSFQNYTTVFGLNPDTEVISILEDEEQNLWFATNNKGLLKYDGEYISKFTTEGGLSSNRISKITRDRNGDLWIATWDHGANRYDGKSFIHLGTEQGLSNEVVTAILPDKYGNIWMATTAGLCKYDGNLFSHIGLAQGLKEEVECILADKRGNLWIGSGVGSCVNKYNGRFIERYTTVQGLGSTNVNQILEDRYGNIWFAARGGVDKYDGRYFTHYSTRHGLIDDAVFCELEDKKGNLWFGTQTGLSKFDGKSFTNYSIAQGLNGGPIYSILEDHRGNLWIGTEDKGVCIFDGVSFTHYDLAHSLSHSMVIGMMEDKNNNIWFCTSKGVNKFDGKYFTWYTTEQGLSNNIAKNAIQDKHGNIWVGTINGMNLFTPQGNTPNTLHGRSFFKKYTASEGFSGGGTYENSITQDTSGNIWVSGTDRVTVYHPEGEIFDTIPPSIQLSGVALFDENVNWLNLEKKKDSTFLLGNGVKLKHFYFSGLTPWYNQPQNLRLAYNNNYITFQFIGITTNRPKEIRYQYFLEGLDKHWSSITEKPEATYNNLYHGNYTFRVKAVNSEGYWSKELTYSFVILPPWWHTWWAYLSYVLAFVTCLWLFIWYRSSRLKQENLHLEEKVTQRTIELERSLQERYELKKKIESQQALLNERLRISRELHDDIGSTLGSISIYSEVAKKRSAKNENANEVLSKIGLASRELIDKMSDIVWSLNPNNESFEQLQNRMMAFAAMMLAPRNISYDFSASEEIKTIYLTGEQRKNIFLIFKEAVYNIVKYADCKNVRIALTAQKNGLVMIIQDDGKGFDVSKVTANNVSHEGEYLGGNGINNMQTRADDMNAIIRIHSKNNEGTTVQLKLEL